MPKIQWTDLPAPLRDHLFDRLRERKITAEDLYQLKLWRESGPDAPEGLCTGILARSRFAAKENFPKPFCCAVNLQKARNWSSNRLPVIG